MFIVKRLRAWLLLKLQSRKKAALKLDAPDICPAVAKDIGIKVTRVRLPSGGEVVIVERLHDEE